MKLTSIKYASSFHKQAFSLVELMIAMSIGLVLSGTVVLLLIQGSLEQRRGYANTTVEENAYTLQAHITSALRGMSASQGFSYYSTNAVTNISGAYQTIYVGLANPNGTYTRQKLVFDPDSGTATYTPNISTPANKTVWFASGQKVKLHNLYFSGSFNPDGSPNSSLINVNFLMDDNGYSQQGINNPASIYRSFSVQMRCD